MAPGSAICREQREDLLPIPFNQQNLLERPTSSLPSDMLDPVQNPLGVLLGVVPIEHDHQRTAVRVVHLVLLIGALWSFGGSFVGALGSGRE